MLWAAESMRGESDVAILSQAKADARVLLTCDKDFGELVYRSGFPNTSGVILFRLRGESPTRDATRMIAALCEPRSWAGHFPVIDEDRIRMRPLPTSPADQ